jgi:hypothetical protein
MDAHFRGLFREFFVTDMPPFEFGLQLTVIVDCVFGGPTELSVLGADAFSSYRGNGRTRTLAGSMTSSTLGVGTAP